MDGIRRGSQRRELEWLHDECDDRWPAETLVNPTAGPEAVSAHLDHASPVRRAGIECLGGSISGSA